MKKTIIYFLIIILTFFTNIHASQSAEVLIDLFVVPEYSSYLNPDSLILNIITNNNETLFNAVSINLKYSPEKITINSINYENSFCEIIAKEEIDNINGFLDISCGNPNPELATSTNMFQINFNKIETGWAQISLNSSKILAHDGLGTNIIGSTEDHNFYIYK